ncbi:hypothetical protein Ancab_033693 [Ancistrocladus abbreviatus]
MMMEKRVKGTCTQCDRKYHSECGEHAGSSSFPAAFKFMFQEVTSSSLPCTQYTFRIVSYTKAGNVGHSEAKCLIESMEIIHRNPNSAAGRSNWP